MPGNQTKNTPSVPLALALPQERNAGRFTFIPGSSYVGSLDKHGASHMVASAATCTRLPRSRVLACGAAKSARPAPSAHANMTAWARNAMRDTTRHGQPSSSLPFVQLRCQNIRRTSSEGIICTIQAHQDHYRSDVKNSSLPYSLNNMRRFRMLSLLSRLPDHYVQLLHEST